MWYDAIQVNMSFKASVVVVHNIQALLDREKVDHTALALFVGHKPSWLSKVLRGQRGVSIDDLDKIADFFDVTVRDLFSPTLGRRPEHDRRHGDRRHQDRRQHP